MNQDRMQFKAIDRDTKEVTEITGFTVNKKKIIKIMWGDGYFDAYANVDIIQSIGKRDKNNVLIFDGDIIGFDSSVTKGLIGVVFWNQYQCRYLVKANNGYTYRLHHEDTSFSVLLKTIEVIGHKLTHPELLKV